MCPPMRFLHVPLYTTGYHRVDKTCDHPCLSFLRRQRRYLT